MGMIVDCSVVRDVPYAKNDLLNKYYADIRNYNILDIEEERKLLVETKSSDISVSSKAREALINSNQRFVVSFAKNFARNDNLLDVIGEANLGLIEAIDNYDINKTVRLITYAAWYMRRYINSYLATNDKLVTPPNAQKLYTYAFNAKNQFINEKHYEPTSEELQEYIQDVYDVRITRPEDLDDIVLGSIDENYDDGESDDTESPYLREFNSMTAHNNVDDTYEKEELSYQVEMFLSILNGREQSIMKMHYGIGQDALTNDDIGKNIGLTGERVRQIIASSEKKIRKSFSY